MTTSYSPLIVTDGLVMYLDAANSKSYPGAGTTWTDISRNGNNGILTNGPTFNSANLGSIVFDGVDDYVDVGNNASLSLSAMTIAAWVKPSTNVSNYRGIIMDESVGGSPWNYRLFLNQGNGVVIYDMIGSGYGSVSSTYSVADNNWHYICGVRTVVNGTLNLYIDGVLNTTGTDSSNRSTLGNRVWIGRSPYNGGSYPFIGDIPITQIYNRALSATEILQNYNATKTRYGL